MKRTTGTKVELPDEAKIHTDNYWENVCMNLFMINSNSATSAEVNNVLKIAIRAITKLQEFAERSPDIVRQYAAERMTWPVMRSFITKMDQDFIRFATHIQLAANIPQRVTQSNMSRLASRVAVDLLHAAHEKRKAAQVLLGVARSKGGQKTARLRALHPHDFDNDSNNNDWLSVLPICKRFKDPLSRETFNNWWIHFLKESIDHKYKQYQNHTDIAERVKSSDAGHYSDSESKRKNEFRKKVKQAIRLRIPS